MSNNLNKFKQAMEDYFEKTAYYEPKFVKSTRKVKDCSICAEVIPIKSSHNSYVFYGEDGEWPTMVVCNVCQNEYSKDIAEMIKR